jgi:hypothetical protein
MQYYTKRDKVTEKWRKLRNEELHKLYPSIIYYSMDQIENEVGGVCSTVGDRRDTHRVLLGKPKRTRSL